MNIKPSTGQLVLIAMTSAVLCILGPMSFPLFGSPVPVSLTNLMLYFILYILGMKRATISYLVYFLIGLSGLPVFSGFSGGPGKVLGPTGGYLIGFFFLTLIGGFFVERWQNRRLLCFVGLLLGSAVYYLFGTVWLAAQTGCELREALAIGVLPFIAVDLAKMVLAIFIGPQIQKRLKKAGL